MDDAATTLSGSEFRVVAAAAGKAQLLMVESLKYGTTMRLLAVYRSVRRQCEWFRVPLRSAMSDHTQ